MMAHGNPDRDLTAGLVLSGGGARGAYQVGVIKALSEALPGPSPFPVITGVSVGAINAAVLAEGADDFPKAARKLEDLWRSLSCAQVFRCDARALYGRLGKWGLALALSWTGTQPPRSLFDASPLAALLKREIDFRRVGRMIDEGWLSALGVTASSYATGFSTTFFQAAPSISGWRRSRRDGVPAAITVDHILASSALPGIFEARQIGQQWYGDGALRQTAPLSPAIHLGCDRMFLIAARDDDPEETIDDYDPVCYPSLGVLGGQLLDIIFNDNLDADQERLERINRTLGTMRRDRRGRTALRNLGTLMVRPSVDVRGIAGQHLREIPWAVKTVLGTIGGLKSPFVLPSYLAFESGYIGTLIDLGYRDTQRDLRQVLAFLGREPAGAMASSA